MRKRMKEKTIYLSEKEDKILTEKCEKLKLSKSECIRQLLSNYQPSSPDINILVRHSEDWKLIGNGLNAVARDANRYGFVNTKDLNHYLNWMNDAIDDMKFNLDIN